MNVKPKIYRFNKYKDKRGFFLKLLSNIQNKKILKNEKILEINCSFNKTKGTVRGLHYQIGKFKEIKLVYCLTGKILDMSINVDKKSKNYNKIYKFILDEKKNNFISIPKNYAHGFQVLKRNTTLIYFHTAKYKKKFERGINPFQNKFKWPLKISKISKKDSHK
jgi:dTDP-4-dehydrorhamnose 3,5-epimerase